MFGTLTNGKNGRVAGAQLVVHENPAIHRQSRIPGQLHVRPDAAADHYHVSIQPSAVLQLHRLHLVIADNAGYLRLHQDGQSQLL
ncbi:hypothetical protein HRbin36_02462 [bacterium HR36]|nr:hypothetical protein HRbin36_02462 [bacterium HR36]